MSPPPPVGSSTPTAFSSGVGRRRASSAGATLPHVEAKLGNDRGADFLQSARHLFELLARAAVLLVDLNVPVAAARRTRVHTHTRVEGGSAGDTRDAVRFVSGPPPRFETSQARRANRTHARTHNQTRTPQRARGARSTHRQYASPTPNCDGSPPGASVRLPAATSHAQSRRSCSRSTSLPLTPLWSPFTSAVTYAETARGAQRFGRFGRGPPARETRHLRRDARPHARRPSAPPPPATPAGFDGRADGRTCIGKQ